MFGLKNLTRIFAAMDSKGDHKLDVDDFRWGLLDYGIEISKEEATEMQPHFDNDNCGRINWTEFVKTIRGGVVLNEARTNCIKKAYEALSKGGSLTLDVIA